MTPITVEAIPCSHGTCIRTAEFDSIFAGEGQVCATHAALETESDGH